MAYEKGNNVKWRIDVWQAAKLEDDNQHTHYTRFSCSVISLCKFRSTYGVGATSVSFHFLLALWRSDARSTEASKSPPTWSKINGNYPKQFYTKFLGLKQLVK
jgi:hypothetical protein